MDDEPCAAEETTGAQNKAEFCVICLSDAPGRQSARVRGCDHEFCVDCLRKWASGRRNPHCPLCLAPLEAILLSNGNVEPVEPSEAKAKEEEADLACLDHTYFLSEAQRLLRRAQAAQNKFHTEAYGYGRGGSHKAEEAFVVLGEVIGSLVNHRQQLELDLPFNPNDLLHELYNLDSIVQSVQAGTWERHNHDNPQRRLYSADDAAFVNPEPENDVDEEELDQYIMRRESIATICTKRGSSQRSRRRKKQTVTPSHRGSLGP